MATSKLTDELVDFWQAPLNLGASATSATIRRTSEKAKRVHPFTLCLRSEFTFNRSA
jgi:hypothetical protein